MTITKSYSGTVYAGTELVLTVDIYFERVDVNLSISIKWDNVYINVPNIKQLVNDTHTTVSAVSGSEGNFKASLTYSPITISDSGRHWAFVSIEPSDRSIHIIGSNFSKSASGTIASPTWPHPRHTPQLTKPCPKHRPFR